MHQGTFGESNHLLKIIQAEASKSQFRIDETDRAVVEAEKLKGNIQISRNNQQIINETSRYLKAIRKMLVEYNAQKKQRSLSAIYSAIYSAKSIIPDTDNVQLKVTKEEAMLVNDRDELINMIEGSAFRATLSFFIRSVILRNTDYLQTQLLDEPLTTLSVESSAALSKYLTVLSNDMQIILTEQKNEIFSESEGVVYEFKKSEGITRVRRID